MGWGLRWEAGLDGKQLPSLLKERDRLLCLGGGANLRLEHFGLKLLLEVLKDLLL